MKRSSAPIRTCVGCGRRDVQARLVRLQVDAAASLDAVRRTRAGRSAYVHADAACIAGLMKSRSLRRSLRRDVPADERKRCVERLGVMNAGTGLEDGARRS